MTFDHVWRISTNLPERKGTLCRVLARGKLNSIRIEFEDGERHIVSRFSVWKVAQAPGLEPGSAAPKTAGLPLADA